MVELSPVGRIIAMYNMASQSQYESGYSWYDTALDECYNLASAYMVPVETVVNVVAVLSPRMNWDKNIEYADNVFRGDYKGIMSMNLEKALRVIDGDYSQVKGPKVTSFSKNILGDIEAVTIDTWAFRIWVGDYTSTPTIDDKLYAIIAADYREAARLLDISPRELQAITWITIRDLVTRNKRTGKMPGQISLL